MPENLKDLGLSLDEGKTHMRDFVPFDNMHLKEGVPPNNIYKAGAVAAIHAVGYRMAELFYEQGLFTEEINSKIITAFVTVQDQIADSK